TDRYGLSASDTATVRVANAPPTLTPAADRTTLAGQSLELTAATFSDPGFTFDPDGTGPLAGTAETFTATIDWGDATGTQTVVPSVTQGSAGVPTTGSIPGTHTYAIPGTYTVTVTVADDDGGTATRNFTITVSPSGTKFFVPDQSAHATFQYADD